MPKEIFISYRRDDTKDAAHHLCTILKAHFGEGSVFIDVTDIGAGDDWRSVLEARLRSSVVVLALIGRHWCDVRGVDGLRRFDDPADPVRVEIETALRLRIQLNPILVNGAPIPTAAMLPPSLHGLIDRQAGLARAEPLNHDVFIDDADRIARSISKLMHRQRRAAQPPKGDSYVPPRRPGLGDLAKRLLLTKELAPRLTRRLVPDRFLRQDPGADIADYSSEVPISPSLPYVEIINWCDALIRKEEPEIEVKVLPHNFVLSSWGDGDGDSIREAAFEAARLEKPRTFNGPAVRVEDCEASARKLWLTVQQARYFDQRRSNLILDYKYQKKNGSVLTLRDLLRHEFGASLPPMHDRRMANTLGVAALILVRSETGTTPYLVSRSRDVAVFNVGGEWHCTASGVAEMQGSDLDSQQFYRASMLKELHEEVGLLEHELDMLEPVAFCREMTRGGKPQMFFLGFTSLDEATLRKKTRNARRKARAMGDVVEHTAMPLLRKPADLSVDVTGLRLYHDKGFTIEAAACLHYYFKCQAIAGASSTEWG